MKKKITIITISLIILLILGISFSSISNAAIEVKPGTSTHTNVTVSTSYQYCYDMRSSTSTLGNNSLDPHLTLNADWSAVAYLGASAYGNVRGASGTTVTISGSAHNSTTNNITGVINFGKLYTQTAALFDLQYADSDAVRNKLSANANTKYVEATKTNTKGQGIGETSGWYSSMNAAAGIATAPVVIRKDVFGYIYGPRSNLSSYPYSIGRADASVTYRPVIWN